MNEASSRLDRRSTRLSIAIPIVISGVDTRGEAYSESVRTLIINKHGGKIATTRRLAMGAEVLIENHAMGLVAKANVAWVSESHPAADLHHVGLQLIEAQNIWGIAFPPDDWVAEQDEESPAENAASATGDANATAAEPPAPSLAAGEIPHRVMQELRAVADACALDFQDRLKELTKQLGTELEFDLRARAFVARDREVGGMDEQIKVLQQSLAAAREEIARLEARVRELKSDLQASAKKITPTAAKEAQNHLIALSNSIVERMNQAAAEGLREYRSLLQKENAESAAKLRASGTMHPAPPVGPSTES